MGEKLRFSPIVIRVCQSSGSMDAMVRLGGC